MNHKNEIALLLLLLIWTIWGISVFEEWNHGKKTDK